MVGDADGSTVIELAKAPTDHRGNGRKWAVDGNGLHPGLPHPQYGYIDAARLLLDDPADQHEPHSLTFLCSGDDLDGTTKKGRTVQVSAAV
ncbi:hypothetical protein [Streptomyces chrestomyceticus]|uniref:Uncharacterized protein n=1 Tax=Streptomyces chrestomyceticus TaxID=68185 RepID=A0ABU7X5F1_9ACTN